MISDANKYVDDDLTEGTSSILKEKENPLSEGQSVSLTKEQEQEARCSHVYRLYLRKPVKKLNARDDNSSTKKFRRPTQIDPYQRDARIFFRKSKYFLQIFQAVFSVWRK